MNPSWPELEITDFPELAPEETCLLDMHSVLNTLNVIQGELALLGLMLAENEELLKPGLQATREFVASLRRRDLALRRLSDFGPYRARILAELFRLSSLYPNRRADPEVMESISNVESVLNIMAVRIRELLARLKEPEHWVCMDIASLRRSFYDVFAAIEKNSKGRYRIIYNLARQLPTDYYIDLVIDSVDGSTLKLPPVFLDVMRDLIANARKYTPPGGTICAGLHEDTHCLRFAVEDNGQGIPAQELSEVVQFGRRGSNVAKFRTLGGGFGLTKAVFVARQFHGRLWLASKLGEGTRVRIEVPRPAP